MTMNDRKAPTRMAAIVEIPTPKNNAIDWTIAATFPSQWLSESACAPEPSPEREAGFVPLLSDEEGVVLNGLIPSSMRIGKKPWVVSFVLLKKV